MKDDVCSCGKLIEQPATGRRRTKCYVCSPRNKRYQRAQVMQLPVRESEPSAFSLTSTTIAALQRAGMHQTWQGMAAIKLAELIDEAKHGASGAAGNTKAHRDAMEFALAYQADDADIINLIFAEESN
jgi:hypothetical protein